MNASVRVTHVGRNGQPLLDYLVETRGFESSDAERFLEQVEDEPNGAILTRELSIEEAEDIVEELNDIDVTATIELEYRVHGAITDSNDASVSNVFVEVTAHSETATETRSVSSNSDGRYEVSFTFSPDTAEDLTIVVRARSPANEELLAESSPVVSPSPVEEVNLQVDLPDATDPTPIDGDEVFRFGVIRPPETASDSKMVVNRATEGSNLRKKLMQRKDSGDRLGMITEANAFLDSPSYISNDTELFLPVDNLIDAVEDMENSLDNNINTLVENVTGSTISNIVDSDEFQEEFQSLGDSLLAATLIPGEDHRTPQLTRALRIYSLLAEVGVEGTNRDIDRLQSDILTRDISLPEELFPLPPLPADDKEGGEEGSEEQSDDDSKVDIKELQQRLATLRNAREELTFAEFVDVSEDESTPVQVDDSGGSTSDGSTSLETDGSGDATDRVDGDDDEPPTVETDNGFTDRFIANADKFLTNADRIISRARWLINNPNISVSSGDNSALYREFAENEELSGDDSVSEVDDSRRYKVLSADAVGSLSSETMEVFGSLDADIDTTDVEIIFDQLEREKRKTERQLLRLAPKNLSIPMLSIGNQLLPATEFQQMRAYSDDTEIYVPPFIIPGVVAVFEEDARIKPIGVMDLEVVRQETKRYELGEVAHIENVLKSEEKDRTHRRKQIRDETRIYETETTEEKERDLQSTERFELQREAEEVIKASSQESSNMAFNADTTISGSYGPSLEIEAGFGFSKEGSSAQQNATEKSSRTASNYARSITERSVNRLKTRIREEKIQRLIEEIEETNIHRFTNTGINADHISGIYRWVDKVYRYQEIQYDSPRMMFEFIVPEPGFLYLWSQANSSEEIAKPVPPQHPFGTLESDDDSEPLLPEDISEDNYQQYARAYGATDIAPPPQRYRIFSEKIELKREPPEEQPEDEPPILRGGNPRYKTESIKIAEEHAPLQARVSIVNTKPLLQSTYFPDTKRYTWDDLPDNFALVNISIGGKWYTHKAKDAKYMKTQHINFENPSDENKTIAVPGSEIPISVFTTRLKYGMAASIEVLAERTDRMHQQWQFDTYNAIMDGYRNQKSEYDEAVAATDISGIPISGNNPKENRRIERDELKRSIVTMLADERLDFNAISEATSSEPIPDIDLTAAADQQDIIHFLENAFEWEQMNYLFYPYYWGRRETWPEKMNLDDPDPLFADFLKSGAARVLVPVRHDPENRWAADIAYYLTHGEPYQGTGRPMYGDPQYVDIIDDIKSRQGVGEDGGTVADEWELTLPTSLVKLQADDELPDFISDVGDE